MLVAFVTVMFALIAGMVVTSRLIVGRASNPIKDSTYECGEVPIGEGRTQFSIQYYAYAIIFTIFDVLALFVIVFFISLADLGVGMIIPISAFLGVIALSLVYAWRLLKLRWTAL